VNRIDVLVAVDTVGALVAGTLQGYVYLVDTNKYNKYLGSWQEGESSLNTVCQDGQLVRWSVVSVDSGTQVDIAGFSGPLVDQKVCIPAQDPLAQGTVWNGQVEAHGAFESFPYTLAVAMGGRSLAFSAFLKVV
jgi:hypothetical protein